MLIWDCCLYLYTDPREVWRGSSDLPYVLWRNMDAVSCYI
jgi:hypothetical protein